jgi:hypothetical protein
MDQCTRAHPVPRLERLILATDIENADHLLWNMRRQGWISLADVLVGKRNPRLPKRLGSFAPVPDRDRPLLHHQRGTPSKNYIRCQPVCDHGKGHSVSVLWRGGEVDTIFGFEKESDALQWIKEKSQAGLIDQK